MHSTISSHSFLQDGCGSIVLGNSWKWQLLRRYFAEWNNRMDQFGEMSKTKQVVHAEMSRSGASGKRTIFVCSANAPFSGHRDQDSSSSLCACSLRPIACKSLG